LVTDSHCFQHKTSPITFIDLFSGMGSFHYALKQIVPNAQCVLASDIDKNCNLTYYKNFGIKPEGDILNLDFKKIPKADILFAGFPCQTFSLMGKKTGLSETVFPLFEKLLNILKFKKIGCFVFENVRNLITMNKGAVFSKMIANFEDLGYTIY
jgi:DNA (cytosine-5)-methyltransferase 1